MVKQDVALISDFLQNLATNGQKVYLVKNTPISDKLKKGTVEKHTNFQFWSLHEIPVVAFDISKAEGYVQINKDFDMPLNRSLPSLSDGPIYFYDKDAAELKIIQLNQTEFELIVAEEKEIIAQRSFLQELIENRRF